MPSPPRPIGEAFGIFLVIAGAAAAFTIHVHQALGHELNHLAQHIDISALVSKFEQGRIGIGHRVFL